MRWMMQAREKTRENQFVQPNTAPVALAILMNFYFSLFLSLSLSLSLSFFRLPFVVLSFVLFFFPLFVSPKDCRFSAVHQSSNTSRNNETRAAKGRKWETIKDTTVKCDGRSANYARRVLLYVDDKKKRCDSYSTRIFLVCKYSDEECHRTFSNLRTL